MEGDGDILDAFDDAEDLKKTIESGREGPWHDETATFTDPKIQQLQEELNRKPRQTPYQQRRLLELQRRAVELEQSGGEPGAKAKVAPAPPVDDVWADDIDDDVAEQAAAPLAATAGGRRVTALEEGSFESVPQAACVAEVAAMPVAPRDSRNPAVSIVLAYVVLASATAVHGLVEGWRVDLGVRGAGAALATGVLWHVLRAQRIRAILIAIVAYCAAFLPVASMDEPQTLFAVLLAIPAVVAGAGIFGMSSRAL